MFLGAQCRNVFGAGTRFAKYDVGGVLLWSSTVKFCFCPGSKIMISKETLLFNSLCLSNGLQGAREAMLLHKRVRARDAAAWCTFRTVPYCHTLAVFI